MVKRVTSPHRFVYPDRPYPQAPPQQGPVPPISSEEDTGTAPQQAPGRDVEDRELEERRRKIAERAARQEQRRLRGEMVSPTPTTEELLSELTVGQADLKDSIIDLKDALLLPPGLIDRTLDAWIIRAITTGTGGNTDDIKQGPSIPVAPGFKVSCRMRHHSTTPDRLGYVAPSKEAVQQAGNRKVLKQNDSFTMAVTNFNKFWFWGDTTATVFELTVEQNPTV